ncbi:GntP family gluconate:H+ symporter [Maribacter vaceletii]|uniref:GntP family gluconate:H+ symporter n=1 Tax=Maribacter vaceletii TaxID=1206816 RepID=A0A495E6M1_9FLAO|nr:SLC13 family permease [Maribacter vaceletii]RKR12209.1 GntP family gluconate:H+ symporter [Maribacter vaceletii]
MLGLVALISCIVLLIVAVTVFKVHPIPALLVSGLLLGLATGSTVGVVTESLLSGFGNTLKWIGLVILFGTLLGEILAKTGGADIIANSIINLFGVKYLPLSMAVIGFLIGIPVFMDVAYLTLLPTILVLSRKSGHSVLVLGLSLTMSLTVAHALIPPTPGPLAVASILNLQVGKIIPLNVVVAIAAIVGGLIWVKINTQSFSTVIKKPNEDVIENKIEIKGFKKVLPYASLLVPLLCMSLGAIFSTSNPFIAFVSNPVWALMIGVVLALPLMPMKNFASELNNYFNESGAKCAIVILITGVGGAFGQVIKDTEIVNSLFTEVGGGNLTVLTVIIPFLLSFLFTTVTGSITVSLITTSSIVAPLISSGAFYPELTAAAIGAGSLGVVHVNSSFFWLFKEVHNVGVSKLLKSLSLLTAIVAFSGGIMVVIIYFIKSI